MLPRPERGGPPCRAVVFLCVAAAAAALAPSASAAERIPPSGTAKAVRARPVPPPFQPLARPVAWPRRTTHPAALQAGKARLAANWPPGSPVTAPRRSSARTVQPAGLNQTGLSDSSGSPPDTTGAIGPSHYLEFVNSKVGVYDRNTL